MSQKQADVLRRDRALLLKMARKEEVGALLRHGQDVVPQKAQ